MDIPDKWVKLAEEPADSPFWRSRDGEEYTYTCDAQWLVTNERVGTKRMRNICRIVREVVVYPQLEEN